MPPIEAYTKYVSQIWESGWLTNNGVCVQQLEKDLKAYLGVKHLFFTSNGTVAIQIAIKALALKGEVITTPFSYVATTSSLVWEHCTPVFVDIDEDTLNIDYTKIEAKITPNTQAILATHVFGNPCHVEQIQAIADKHKLKVIYDAAHAFGTQYKNQSVLNFGDISTLSFHATKIFHTIEGGAIVTNDDDLAHKISYMRNFGHNGYEAFYGIGINGKNSEFHAAMGLCILPDIANIIAERKTIAAHYDLKLAETSATHQKITNDTTYNYAYYPVVLPSESAVLKVIAALNEKGINPRRYFYPSLNTLPYLAYQPCPISEGISKRILCLPFFNTLEKETIAEIAAIVSLTLA